MTKELHIERSVNNLDLIRLFAALQVALHHAASHLHVDGPWSDILNIFPGVPIFFFVSGFLIYQSWGNIRENRAFSFMRNRILRLFPALYFCFGITVVSLVMSGYLGGQDLITSRFLSWAVTQLTFFQFYNPDFLRGYGVGVVNGSLWTICVELQFYILTPVLYMAMKRGTRFFLATALALAAVNVLNSIFNDRSGVAWKLFSVSFIPWIWMFMIGAYVSTNKKIQEKIVSIGWHKMLSAYIAVHFASVYFELGIGNSINPISFLILAAIILKAAYTAPTLADSILRKNDISYGVYIFHMPIVNFLVFKGMVGSIAFLAYSILLTIFLALLSWFFVEKPALSMKKITLRKLTS